MKNNIIPFIFILSAIVSCVPASKFTELQQEKERCVEEREFLKKKNEELSVENTELKDYKNRTSGILDKLAKDTLSMHRELADLEDRYNQLMQEYEAIQETQETLLKGSARETKRLLNQIQASQDDLQQREDELMQLAGQLDEKKKRLDNLQYELEKRNARLLELEHILSRKDSAVNALKQKVQQALLGFQDQGLSVTQKNGKVYVSLEEKLLFGSGSTVVDANGVRALKSLSGVLEQNPDINIMIEGHTDDVPVIESERMKDNWDLSVLRATSIVRILLENSTIDPQRLTVAGRGEYLPLDPRKTDEARRINRRTEIILTPDLDELFDILDNTSI
ncbi:MAG: OmpA family protein [Bacteroidetes bacterium]|nr:OmpA family protein [Bacteroidota bacterium]